MTNQIFITGREKKRRKMEKGYWYSHIDGILNVYYEKEVIYTSEVQEGDAFVLICTKKITEVRKMIPPKRDGDLIAWLIGFSRFNRATTQSEYERILDIRRKRNFWEGYEEWHYIGEKYIITRCNRCDKEKGYHNVAGYIQEDISKEEIFLLIPLMVFPHRYSKRILKERFGITEEEFEQALEEAIEI